MKPINVCMAVMENAMPPENFLMLTVQCSQHSQGDIYCAVGGILNSSHCAGNKFVHQILPPSIVLTFVTGEDYLCSTLSITYSSVS